MNVTVIMFVSFDACKVASRLCNIPLRLQCGVVQMLVQMLMQALAPALLCHATEACPPCVARDRGTPVKRVPILVSAAG